MIVLGMRTIRYQKYRLDQSVILYIGASYTTLLIMILVESTLLCNCHGEPEIYIWADLRVRHHRSIPVHIIHLVSKLLSLFGTGGIPLDLGEVLEFAQDPE